MEWEGVEVSEPTSAQTSFHVIGEGELRGTLCTLQARADNNKHVAERFMAEGYKHGEIAVVQAIPEEGYLFNGWTGAECGGSGGCIHTAGNNH